jgi:hypothetical protein
MNPVTCPRCHGCGEEYEPASDVECRPPQFSPCTLCGGFGEVEDGVATLYESGQWQWGRCGECEQERIIVETGDAELCAECAVAFASVPF